MAPAVEGLVGRRAVVEDRLDAQRVDEYRNLFGLGPEAPLLACHWGLFGRFGGALRADGHPVEMVPLPALPFPRRRWAGGRMAWAAPILPGRRLVRETEVVAAEMKSGRTGAFLLASLRHRVVDEGALCVEERQDLAFLPAGRFARPPEAAGPTFEVAAERACDPSAVDLFRYSALTRNGHRIHYDAGYAKIEEGYPGIVVHGPYIATVLMHLAADAAPRRPVAFDYRAERPVFLGEGFRAVHGALAEDRVPVAAVASDGATAMSATLTVAVGP